MTTRAVWPTKYVNDLPDSAFLHIRPGGRKDASGKTVPRSLRMFPYKDKSGKVDLPHLRNALARIPQSKLPEDVKKRLAAKARRLLSQTKRSAHGGDLWSINPMDGSFRDGGAHAHPLSEDDGYDYARGGAHRHIFLLDDGRIALTDLDGVHQHDGSGSDAHDHVVAIQSDAGVEVLRTKKSEPHAHERLSNGSTYAGVHTCTLSVGGKTYRSLAAEEIREATNAGKLSYEALLRAKSLTRRHVGSAPPAASAAAATAGEDDAPVAVARKIELRSEAVKRGIVYGVVLSPHSFDTYETWFDPATIETAAHDWLIRSRLIDRDHEKVSDSVVVESFIEPYPGAEDEEKAMRNEPHRITERPFGGDVVRSGEWIVAVRLSDEDRAALARGELSGLSINGTARRRPLTEGQGPPATEVVKMGPLTPA